MLRGSKIWHRWAQHHWVEERGLSPFEFCNGVWARKKTYDGSVRWWKTDCVSTVSTE